MDIVHGQARVNSRAEALAEGRAARRRLPRKGLARSVPHGRDPIAILEEQNAIRLQDLIPLRTERMLASPFAFYRGTAALMAADLGEDPHTGLIVASCGDAHLSNFGFFASPERRLVFDLNDFDEAGVAPWEWDVKRLATSVVVGGVDAGYDEAAIRAITTDTVRTYQRSMASLLAMSPVARYFLHGNIDNSRAALDDRSRGALDAALARAQKRTSERAVRRTTEVGAGGVRRFVEEPPRMTHMAVEQDEMLRLYAEYRAGVGVDLSLVLSQYAPVDVVRRVVGVGSVGTRCFLVLLEGADVDTLLLQVKEATETVLNRYGGMTFPDAVVERFGAYGDGHRVVALQRVLQVVSDPFLGHFRLDGRDYYVRQFHDMKGSMELDGLGPEAFGAYAATCATMLARAHAQSPGFARIVGYLGRNSAAADAIVDWSFDYAEQSLRDFRAFRDAVATGRLPSPPETVD